MSWNDASEQCGKKNENEIFLRYVDDSVEVMFCGEPYGFNCHGRYRVLMNLYDYANKRMRFFNFTRRQFAGVISAREMYDLPRFRFKLEKEDRGLSIYLVTPPIKEEEAREIASLPLLDLRRMRKELFL